MPIWERVPLSDRGVKVASGVPTDNKLDAVTAASGDEDDIIIFGDLL